MSVVVGTKQTNVEVYGLLFFFLLRLRLKLTRDTEAKLVWIVSEEPF